MALFKKNKIYLDSETVAEQLRSARQAKKLKLFEAAKKLNISEKYLDALERGEYKELPRGVYGKNFLREYALFLGLDYKNLSRDYETETDVLEPKTQKDLFAKQIVKARHLWAAPKIFKNVLVFLVIAVCFAYLGYRVNKIISPPLLIISRPAASLVTNQAVLEVAGRTEAEASLTINGQTVLTDKNGDFFQAISLKSGINIIIITANKKYGRAKTVTRQVLVKAP